jgi:hypothetical protein
MSGGVETARSIAEGQGPRGPYGTVLPDTLGIIAFVAATAILLLGMVLRGI